MYAGRNSGKPNRTLTKFLRDSKIKVVEAESIGKVIRDSE